MSHAEQKPEPAAESKTPLDNLKGMLAKVDDGAAAPAVPAEAAAQPAKEPVQAAPAVVQAASGETVLKTDIAEALKKVEQFTDEMLSPRQVDSVLRSLLEGKKIADLKKYLEQGAQETQTMAALKSTVVETKGKPEKGE